MSLFEGGVFLGASGGSLCGKKCSPGISSGKQNLANARSKIFSHKMYFFTLEYAYCGPVYASIKEKTIIINVNNNNNRVIINSI